MNHRFAYQDSLQDRITEGMHVMRIALDQQAPYLALATAREASRAALLALGQGALNQTPLRAGKRELALLREVATATSQRFAGRPAERQALVSATLALLGRLFPRPAVAQGRAGNDRPGAGPGGTGDHPPHPKLRQYDGTGRLTLQ
jgi:hypothetical protein